MHARRREDLPRLAAALAPLGQEQPRLDEVARRITVPDNGGRAADRTPFAAVAGTGDAYWRRWTCHPAGGRGAFATSGDAAAATAVVDHLGVIRARD